MYLENDTCKSSIFIIFIIRLAVGSLRVEKYDAIKWKLTTVNHLLDHLASVK